MDRANPPRLEACLTDEQMSEWAEGSAPTEERARCEAHIARCDACATLAALMGARDGDLPRGTLVGRYEIVSRIGAGAMGTVYAAHDPALDRRVALKLIRAAIAGPELETRLLREAKAMARLSHPDVIPVYDAGRDGERLFITMELVDGGTLREWLAERPRSWREVLGVYLHAGRGLAQAHELGLIHRDFKPDNVLVGKDGRVRVTDFGLARNVQSGEERESIRGERIPLALDRTAPAPLTQTGALVGTPAYMAPEQFEGHAADVRSDIYAFCVALYEALYGDRPFGGTTFGEHKDAKDAGAPKLPSSHRGVPARLRQALVRGLRPKPEERYASMADLLADLEEVARSPLLGWMRSRAWMSAMVAGLATVVAAGGWMEHRRSRAHPAAAPADSVATAVGALAGPEGLLACPIFEVRGEGMDDVTVPTGAAAAALACARLAWEMGGRNDRVLPPAALLGIPREPADGLADPYASREQRARTIQIAKARGAAYVDGVVDYGRSAWSTELVLRAPDDREIVRANGTGDTFLHALLHGLESLWHDPLARSPVDPEVARWTGFSTTDLGALWANMWFYSAARCKELVAPPRASNAVLLLERMCQRFGEATAVDGGAPVLDESSPEALATSVQTFNVWDSPIPADQARRLADELDGFRAIERSAIGRSRLAFAAGLLWFQLNEQERAQSALRSSLRDDPVFDQPWVIVAGTAGGGTPASTSTSTVARAWMPYDGRLVPKAGSWRGDELDERLRDAHLAYLLEPELVEALHLGRALAEAGRADEAREVAATPLGDEAASKRLTDDILGLIDLHDARIARGISHLEEAGNVAMHDLLVAADVSGRAEEVATRWAARFLARSDHDAGATARGYHSPMLLCMRARRDLATRCLARIARLGQGNWWYEGGTSLLEGANRYAAGDFRGAVSAWRALVACPSLEIVRGLPTEVFEQAGEHELAARLDERKMAFTFIAGVSDAAPREAIRALAKGDVARARKLARDVVEAWQVADLEVPAVAQMRALLAAP